MSPALRREIGLPSAVLLVIGGIVGSGIFMNPGVVARSLHSPVLILAVWVVGGLVALLGAFVYAELAQRMPETGGEYAYQRAAFGPMTGFLFGWTSLLVVQTGGMAAVAITFATYFQKLVGWHLDNGLVAVAVLAGLALANCVGVRAGNGVQASLGVLKLAAIAGLVFGGLFLIAKPFPVLHPVLDRPVSADLAKAFGAGLIPVMFAYGGWQTANFVGGEIKDPRKNLALALLIGVIGVIGVYIAVNVACLNALGSGGLASSKAAAADVLSLAVGPVGATLASLAIAISTLGYLSQSMLTSPRVYYAMAKDGLFFRQVATVTEGGRTPVLAIAVQTVWTAILVLCFDYEKILSYVVATNFVFFAVTGCAVFVLRARAARAAASATPGPGEPPGFLIPFHPITTALFVLACVVVVGATFWAAPTESLIGFGILALGVPVYFFWRWNGRREAKETPAP
jgi:APA family basic amino acid/polyamine antiporter